MESQCTRPELQIRGGIEDNSKIIFLFCVKPTSGKARHSCYYFAKVYVLECVHGCVHPSGFVRATIPTFMHGFQNYFTQLLSLRKEVAFETFFR